MAASALPGSGKITKAHTVKQHLGDACTESLEGIRN
jgi:hypothetical protein